MRDRRNLTDEFFFLSPVIYHDTSTSTSNINQQEHAHSTGFYSIDRYQYGATVNCVILKSIEDSSNYGSVLHLVGESDHNSGTPKAELNPQSSSYEEWWRSERFDVMARRPSYTTVV